MSQLTFQAVTLSPIFHNNQTYISASDLARALQYKCVQSIANIFNRNEDEFTADMSEVINSVTSGNLQTTQRIFSLRGCHLIAMFARTPVAKDFRKWVLDILDKEISQNSVENRPLAPQKKKRGHPAINPFGYETYEREFTAKELEVLVQLWYYANRQHQFLKSLAPAFDVLQSHYTDELKRFWGDSMSIDWAGDIIARIADGADVMRFAPLIELEKASRRKQALLNARF